MNQYVNFYWYLYLSEKYVTFLAIVKRWFLKEIIVSTRNCNFSRVTWSMNLSFLDVARLVVLLSKMHPGKIIPGPTWMITIEFVQVYILRMWFSLQKQHHVAFLCALPFHCSWSDSSYIQSLLYSAPLYFVITLIHHIYLFNNFLACVFSCFLIPPPCPSPFLSCTRRHMIKQTWHICHCGSAAWSLHL